MRVLKPFTLLCLSVLLASSARAADPTTADCLAASDASLKAGNEHKLRAERAQLLICAAPSCPADIRKECTRRVEEVNAAIPTIVFEVKDAAGNDLSAVKVSMDGEVLAERLEGSALSIDPGEHTFTFEAAGQPVTIKQLLVREAEKERRELVRLGGVSTNTGLGTQTSAPPLPAGEPSGGLGGQKIGALVAAGVGVVGLGLGSAFGLSAMSKKDRAEELCPNQCADDAGVEAWRDARSAGNLSTVFFIIGGVGVAAAATLWFTAPRSSGATQVGVSPTGLQLRSSF
ncbi:MAG: hypothetical protein ACOY0T_14635 [Myxococcota bacterium]